MMIAEIENTAKMENILLQMFSSESPLFSYIKLSE